ncbi:MAG: TonB-dependent receptor [Acidobacteria bacterium]|nr:TonB-dependent receptor [Acidobacteriota bacterium]
MSIFRLLTLVSLAAALFAQEFRATLQGTVTDPSQSVVAGAAATLRNTDTSVTRQVVTSDLGHYLFSFLAPGNYSLSVAANGFKTVVRDKISLSVSQDARIDLQLEVGGATETVTVSSEISLVQPDSSALGTAVRKDIIEGLPLKGHSSLMMYNLSTGVVSTRIGEDIRPNDTASNMLTGVNGAPMAAIDVAVDGVPNTVDLNRGAGLSPWVPSTESVAEFKLQSGTLPAEYGRSGGAFMNVVIKSGSNELHGAAYEFFRNASLDANQYFARGRGRKLAAFGANTFGGSIGGPIVLPKLFNGRNHSFFYANFEGSREGNAIDSVLNVPTIKMRQGDFSEVSAPIFNPLSVRPANGVPTRDPFPGNIIPASLQDPVGRNIVTYYPEPTRTGPNAAAPWVQNFGFSGKWPRNYNMLVVKTDHYFTEKHHTFVRVNYGTAKLVYPHQFDGVATAGRDVNLRPHSGIGLNETYMISPRTTLDVRLGWAGGVERFFPWSDGFDVTKLGFSQNYKNLLQRSVFPTVAVNGFASLSGSRFQEEPGHTYSSQGSLSHQHGKHLIKTGGEARLVRGSFFRNPNPAGSFSFGLTQTGGPRADTPVATSGFGVASLLMGYGSGQLDFNTAVSVQNLYYGLYLQDDFRITRKLTLNLGVRYEYEGPRTERYNRTTRGFAFGTRSPLQVRDLNLQGGLIYAGVGGQPRGLYQPDRNNVAPRIGFAYSLTSKTILRGGYALSYIPVLGTVQPTGFNSNTPWVSSTDGINVTDRLLNPFPRGRVEAIGSSQGLSTLAGQAIAFVEPADRTPRFHNWQFNIQRELPSQTLLEVAYIGSRTIGTFGGLDAAGVPSEQINQLDPRHLSMGAALLEPVANPFFGILTSGPISGATVARNQLLRPYPQFSSVIRAFPALGNTSYHSMQLQVQKRMAHGVTAIIGYTRAKNIGDLFSAQNNYDRRAERAVSAFDLPHRLTVTGAWNLPVGKDRAYLANASKALHAVVGGWQLSTFSTFQSGFPLSFSLIRGTLGAGGTRPDAAGDPTSGITGGIGSRLNRYFNTAAFAQPPDFTFGNVSPRLHSVRAPGMNNVNLTLAKGFSLTEKARLDFRAAAYNLLNHPVFSAPNTQFGNPAFGTIAGQANFSRQTELWMRISF